MSEQPPASLELAAAAASDPATAEAARSAAVGEAARPADATEPGGPISRRPAARPGLSAARLADVRALAEALFTPDGTRAPPSDRLAWFERDLSDFLGHLHRRARLLFLACLATTTWIAPLLILRVGRLRSLSLPDRVRAIEALERTPAALALLAVKAVVSIVWWEHPDNAREIGWDRACLKAIS